MEKKREKRLLRDAVIAILFAFIVFCCFPMQVRAQDDYPSKYKSEDKDAVTDEWNFYNRECTSFCAWCLNSRNGVAFHNYYGGVRWGNAKNWGDAARSIGITVDSTPVVGAIAYTTSGNYGHVAWVSAVNGDSVSIEEYNRNGDGAYHERTVNKSEFTGYIHIKDIVPEEIIHEGIYKICLAKNPGYCLDIWDDSKDSGANVQLYHVIDTPVQQFEITKSSGGYYYIKSVWSGHWLDIKTPIENRANVQLYESNTNTEENWYFEDAGDGNVYIRNKTGYYLDLQWDKVADNSNIQVFNQPDTKWKLVVPEVEVEPGFYKIHSAKNSGYCLDILHDSTESGANIQLYHNLDTDVQIFEVMKSSGGYYFIKSVWSGMWLDVKSPVESGSNVQLFKANTYEEDNWQFADAGDGKVYIRNKRGFFLDLSGGVVEDNRNIIVYNFNGTEAQKWQLEKITFSVAIDSIEVNSTNAVLKWTPSSNAQKYTVERKMEGESNWTVVGEDLTTTEFTDEGLQGGSKYSYRVKAYFAACGWSDYSSEVSVTTSLASPVIEEAKVASGKVTLSWNAVSGATKYAVYRKEGSGSWVNLSKAVTKTSYNDESVEGGKKYAYFVKAYSKTAGWSGSSAYAKVTTLPDAAETITTKAESDGITVTWSKVASATKYGLYRRSYNGSAWTSWSGVVGQTGVSFKDTNVVAGTKYQYRVRAYNGAGWGAFKASTTVTAQAAAVVPEAPETIKVAGYTGKISITWTKVDSATKYCLYRRMDDGSGWTTWKAVSTQAAVSYADKDVSKTIKYQYRVRAYNAAGWSTFTVSGAVKPK